MATATAEQQRLQLAVAKAAFSATLSAPGEPKLPAQLVARLQSLLSAVTAEPSQRNVKECRVWILERCASPKQVNALVRFIAAYSATLPTFRQRLALVYVMNDVLFHATRTFRETKAFVPSATTQYIPGLIKSTQVAEDARTDKLNKVLKLWTENGYFSDEELFQIMERPVPTTTEKPAESKPLVKPYMLGRTGDPHWLLPEFSNNYKPIPPSNVKALKLSDKTNPDLINFVQNFESSLHNIQFKEEENSEDEFDLEGWNLKFWKDIQGREQRQREERIRQRALETIGRIKAGQPAEGVKRGRSPERSYSRDSDSSRSQSQSPRRRKEIKRSYSVTPPPSRRRRLNSRSPSRSPSPRKGRAPVPSSTSPQFRPSQQGYPPSATYSSTARQYPYAGQSGYPAAPPMYGQPPPAPVNSGYYRDDGVAGATSSWGYSAVSNVPTGPSHGSGRSSSGGNYDPRTSEGHSRDWR